MNSNEVEAAECHSIPVFIPPTTLTICCGTGEIVISFSDGSVILKNCELDQAAKAFWEKVTEAYPAFREAVIQGQK